MIKKCYGCNSKNIALRQWPKKNSPLSKLYYFECINCNDNSSPSSKTPSSALDAWNDLQVELARLDS